MVLKARTTQRKPLKSDFVVHKVYILPCLLKGARIVKENFTHHLFFFQETDVNVHHSIV